MQKIILISNRLPITIERSNKDFVFTPSVGGLATGLSSVSQKYNCVWLGYPGILSNDLSDIDKRIITDKLITTSKVIRFFWIITNLKIIITDLVIKQYGHFSTIFNTIPILITLLGIIINW